MSPRKPLHTSFPWTQSPLIVNAPMGGIAGSALALAVSRAGGLGLMGIDPAGAKLDPWLDEAVKSLNDNPIQLITQQSSSSSSSSSSAAAATTASLPYLPLGIGFLVTFMKLDIVMTKLQRRTAANEPPPAVIWFFAADEPSIDAYALWATTIRSHYAQAKQHIPQIWIQVGGSATAAVELATSEKVRPDALVIQGSDAGGHGMERGASIVGLVPEVIHLLDQAYKNNTTSSSTSPTLPLPTKATNTSTNTSTSTSTSSSGVSTRPYVLASGGIVSAPSALAALSLGAEGIVMGTRFLTSPETVVHEEYRNRVLAARDGAQATIRAKIFDELAGPNVWPVAYDGRALVSRSWRDRHEDQVPIEAIRDGFAQAKKRKDGGFGVESDRAVVWCGTGVGLVNEVVPAGEVVRSVREGVVRALEDVRRRIGKGAEVRL